MRLVCAIALAGWLAGVPCPAKDLPVLTSAGQVARLSPEEAARGYPVRLNGILTLHYPERWLYFFGDRTGGVYLDTPKGDLRTGQRVEVTGITGRGTFTVLISSPEVRVLGPGQLPPAVPASMDAVLAGKADCRWVATRGVVRSATLVQDSVQLKLAAGQNRLVVDFVNASLEEAARLVGATVVVRGVGAIRENRRRQVIGFRLVSPGLEHVRVEEPPLASPWAAPLVDIEELPKVSALVVGGRRIRIRGTVLASQPGRGVFLRDHTHTVFAQAAETEQFRPGDTAEAVGFAGLGAVTPALEDALLRKVGGWGQVKPQPITAEQAVSGDRDWELVTLSGRLLALMSAPDEGILAMQSGSIIFDARLPGSTRQLPALRPGSLLSLTGLCSPATDESGRGRGMRLLLRSTADIQVLEAGPWWTPARTGIALLLLAAAILAALGWAFALRSRVRAEVAHGALLEQRYRELVENAADFIYTRDLSGRLTSVNPAAERILGYSREELLGRSIADLVAPEQHERAILSVEESNTHDVSTEEAELTTKSGERKMLEISTRLVRAKGQPVRVEGIGRDVSERNRAAQELQRAKNTAESASRAKSQFLANMSHEIRTPLNGIIGMADLLLAGSPDPDQRDLLSTIRASGENLLAVIGDILDLSKIEAGRMELEIIPFRPRALMSESERVLLLEARKKRLALTTTVAPEVPEWVEGDPTRIRQVLINLLGNAVKFTEAGSVALRLDACECNGAVDLALSVRDTGIGIPPEKQSSVFDAFAQADGSTTRKYGGTGLGLAICARLVAMMGGRLWLESEPGRGSTFHATFPVRRCDAPATSEPPQPGLRSLSSFSVLLVEDNPVNQKIASRILQKAGHQVEVAASGAEALERIGQREFDLVLMDVQMPGLDGFETTALLRQRENGGRRIPVLALTAHASSGDRERCLQAGMDGYLTKPVRERELLAAVENAVQPDGRTQAPSC